MATPSTHRLVRITVLALALSGLLWLLLVMQTPTANSALGDGVSFTVDTTADEADAFGAGPGTGCSLREAIQSANLSTGVGGCTAVPNLIVYNIVFVPSGTYTLTRTGPDEDVDATGDLDVRRTMLISATGPTRPLVTANPGWNDRIFDILTRTATINGFEIRGGNVLTNSVSAGGGAALVAAGATLRLNDSVVANNTAGGIGLDGGGISNLGTLTLNRVTFGGNASGRDGGGIFNDLNGTATLNDVNLNANTSGRDGGGIRNDGILTLTNAAFISNTANFYGGAISNQGGAATLTNLTLNGNHAQYGGGGISNDRTGTLTLLNATFSGNSASTDGGGLLNDDGTLSLTNVTFSRNSATHDGGGAWITGTLALSGAQFLTNTAGNSGGGLYAGSALTLSGTPFISNTAGNSGGGAAADGPATLNGGLFQNNSTGGSGGGISVFYTLTLTATQFLSNSAVFGGGGAYAWSATLNGGLFQSNRATGGSGGGLAVGWSLNVMGTQFLGNTASDGGGGLDMPCGSGDIVNALFARNEADNARGAAISVYFGPFCDPLRPPTLQIRHSTLVGDGPGSGEAITYGFFLDRIIDTIITSYTVGISYTDGGFGVEDYNLFFANGTNTPGKLGGTHDVIGDPAFVDPATYDYHLRSSSAAINHGIYAGVLTDIDGHVRPQGAGFDIGAVEFAAIANLNASTSGAAVVGRAAFFTATIGAGDDVQYTWNFGDGTTTSALPSAVTAPTAGPTATHTYAQPGTYTVVVTATNALGSQSATTGIQISDAALVALSASHSSPSMLNSPIYFTATVGAGTNVTYTWNFGDGEQGSGGTTVHTYSSTGSYTAVVTATNTINTLSATTRVTVTAGLYLPLIAR